MKDFIFCFDAVGTLIKPHETVWRVYHRYATEYGSQKSHSYIKDNFSRLYQEIFCTPHSFEWLSSESLERDRWRSLISILFNDVVDKDTLFEALWAHYADPHSWSTIQKSAHALKHLLKHDQAVYIASNFDERLFPIIHKHFPALSSDNIFVSSHIGYAKPDKRFFIAIENKLRSSHETRFILIGDNPINDLAGAIRAGWECLDVERIELLKNYL